MSSVLFRIPDELDKKIRAKAEAEEKSINGLLVELCEMGLAVSEDRTYTPALVNLIRSEIRVESSNLYSMLVEQLSDTEERLAAKSQIAASASLAGLIAGADSGRYLEDAGTYQLAGAYMSYGEDAESSLEHARKRVGSQSADDEEQLLWEE